MNSLFKILGIIGTIAVTSLYLFPFVTVYLPSANTKMVLAAIGLIWATYDAVRKSEASLGRDFITLSIWAGVVSLIGLFSMVYNETPDSTYATYIVSMWVWLGGAYTVVSLIRFLHGGASVRLVGNYLIAVCVAQCIIAFAMDQQAWLKNLVDSFVISEGFMGRVEGRLYGIGASLDVAGMRFAAILIIIIACLLDTVNHEKSKWGVYLYTTAYFIIGVIGNMIGRTTSVGIGISLAFFVLKSIRLSHQGTDHINLSTPWKAMGMGGLIFLPMLVYLYDTNAGIHDNIRFGFEGFFSLWETGKWETHSNNQLAHMVVYPQNLKTWLIGDAYFDGPSETDPYYTGPVNYGFYKYTDIGYLRFIFYFGLLGTIAFFTFMFKVALVCIRRFPKWTVMFGLILMLNYLVWFKVASDLFSILAIYLCVQQDENEMAELKLSADEDTVL